MKPASMRWSRRNLITNGLPGLLTVPTMWLMQVGLQTEPNLLSSSGGWQSFVARSFLFGLILNFWRRCALLWLPPEPPPPAVVPDGLDPYSVAQAELAAERAASKV